MAVVFNTDYKKKCYDAFRFSPFVEQVMLNLDTGHSDNLRSYIDAAIDDLQHEINQNIGEGEHAIHNARVAQLKYMYACWYELFNLLDTVDTDHELLSSTSN